MKEYRLSEYIDILNKSGQILKLYGCDKILNKKIEYMTYNSKDVEDNSIFICKGDYFKVDYLNDAIKNGATIYVSDKKYDIDCSCIIVKDIRVTMSILSEMYFDFPGKHLNKIGITGTKGKTTTSFYIKYILDEYAKENLKKDTAIISSLTTYDGIENFESHLTTPESYEIEKHFRNAVDSKIENVVMEVSSQAYTKKYGRLHNIKFDIGVFLNISEDHVSPIEHPTFEDYFSCKLKLFENTKIACINLDSDFSDKILNEAKRHCKKIVTFSINKKEADIYAYDISKQNDGTHFKVKTDKFDSEFVISMPGKFNVENALAAIAVADILNIDSKYMYLGLKNARTSGRMELFKTKDEKIVSIVDFAHNKLSFEKIYETVKNEYNDRFVITVFGCPGGKAQIRRKNLGEVAGKNSDRVYITADDPGIEEVSKISDEIEKYLKVYIDTYEKIEDREEAIQQAFNYAKNLDKKSILLILGKGSDNTQKVLNGYEPYKSDVEQIKEYIKEYNIKKLHNT